MSDRIGDPAAKPRWRFAVVAAALIMMVAESVWLQAASQPSPLAPQEAETEPLPEPRKENPGLINEIGKLLEKPASMLPTLKSPKETIDSAADALSRLTTSPGVKGRAACPVAANGAPDCKAAADKLCQSKGFKGGKSLDVDTARNCSAKALLSGRKPDESECRTETYVTRAVCQ
jgi:hypothetical protein